MNYKQQQPLMSEHMDEQQYSLCVEKRIEELEAQVRVMHELLTRSRPYISDQADWGRTYEKGLLREVDAALAGKLPGVYELPEMNPDWSKAPAWAKFWAVDFDGMANWFSHEPKESMCRWCYQRRRGAQHQLANQFAIDVKKIKKTHLDFWWRDTLATNPSPESTK